MQHRTLLIVLLVVSLCTFYRAARSEPVPVTPGTIVGKWQATERHPERGNIDTVFVINADRTFSGSLSINNEPVWDYSGVWKLEGNLITWEYLKSNLVLLQEDQADTDEILSVTDATLTYRSVRRGTESTLHRSR